MIIIRTCDSEISFSKSSYAIYLDYKSLDEIKDAERKEKAEEYEWGDIIILTPMAKYSFNGVPFAFDWVTSLLDYIDERRNEENIFIDMEQLMKYGEDDFCYFGHTVIVEYIK